MTQQTNYQLPTAELTQAGTFFANLGLECPWVGEDAWCDLLEERIQCCTHWGWVDCPPAVAAAVVDFGQRVIEWMRAQHKAAYVSFEAVPDKLYFWGTRGNFGKTADRLEAYTALILGVWQAMGGE